ncbi:hypothetical protein Tco_0821093 [Tanacetum coccineum]|uniref:Uncharacterized protein n=1 Tax=Tanacetum coccineum TaxID=301880 RepID=A0ABQ5AFK9_9ASTR
MIRYHGRIVYPGSFEAKPNGKLIWKSIQVDLHLTRWSTDPPLLISTVRTLNKGRKDSVDEYERFRAIGNESIHDYFAYVVVSMDNVKQNMDISTTPYVQIYTHLKAYEPHAKKTLKKQEQYTSIVDPLAYVCYTTLHIANLLSGFQKQFVIQPTISSGLPPTQGLMLRCMMAHCYDNSEGKLQCKEPKEERWTLSTFKDKALLMKLKRKGDVVGCEAESIPH